MARDGKQIGVVLKQQDYEELANIARSKDISISALVRSTIIEHFHLPSNIRHPISSGAAKKPASSLLEAGDSAKGVSERDAPGGTT